MIPSGKQPDLHEALLCWNTPNVVLNEYPDHGHPVALHAEESCAEASRREHSEQHALRRTIGPLTGGGPL